MHKSDSAPCGAAPTCFKCPYPDCTWTGHKSQEAFLQGKRRMELREKMKEGREQKSGLHHQSEY